jgi:excisionase family DNA binding protein
MSTDLTDTKPHWTDQTTLSVEAAGEALGLGRSASYDAVRRGDIPVIRIGRRLLVPVPRLKAMLGLPPA